MQELFRQLQEYTRGMWRFRRWAVLVAWTICVAGWLVVLALPPVYEATSRVYVDTTAVLRPLLQGIAVEQDVQAQLNYVRQVMLSRPQLERVARETDLDLRATNEAEKEEVIETLRENLTINNASSRSSRDQSSLYTITTRDSDPQKALKVVQTLVNSFVEDSLGGKRTGADVAQRFLRQQIDDYDKRLADAENRLADFKKRNIGLVPGTRGDYFSRLQSETDGLQRVEEQLRLATQRRAELQRQLTGESSTKGGVAAATATPESTQRIIAAQRRLDELSLTYTDKHPEVIAARETLEQLKTRQAEEVAALQSGQASQEVLAGMSSNPVFQQIQLQLNQTDVEIASLRSEINLRQQKIAGLRSMLDTAPEVEAEFARLNRDYDVIKGRYTELVARLERAQISDDAEQTGVVRFEVIDPPAVRLQPVAPERPRLLTMVLVGGLLAGIGVALLLHLMKPVFTSTRSLTEVTGVPVLGAVALTWVERYHTLRRGEVLRLTGAAAALVAVFAVVLAFQDTGARVIQSLARWA
jgi:polysaccharide chain length determinant protein (PEP-CTERM system associated)